MRAVRTITPIAESGARELRRILFQGTSDDLASVFELARTAEELNLLELFQACYEKKSSIAAEAQREVQRAAVLTAVLEGITRVGLRAEKPMIQSLEADSA
jgi:hypothetical protein